VTGGFSLETVNPKDLNGPLETIAPLASLIGFRLKGERGLFAPSFSHWAEVGYFIGSTQGQDIDSYSQKVRYLSVVPLGVSYWFKRTGYVDIGLSAGLGFATALRHETATTPLGATTASTTVVSEGKTALIGETQLTGRFWLSRVLAVTAFGGLRFLSSPMTTSTGTSVKGEFNSLSLGVGVTYAFGGAKGVGRTYVEVLPADSPKNVPVIPVPGPSARPSGVPSPAPAKGWR
jgi:hypothetical protein